MRRFVPLLAVIACGKTAVPSAPPAIGTSAVPAASVRTVAPAAVDPIATLAATPGTSLVGVWRRRLAAAWQATHDAKSPEVTVAAAGLRANARWISLDDEIALLTSIAPLAPVFEEQMIPEGLHLHGKSSDPTHYRERMNALEAGVLPARLALYEKLTARGRSRIVSTLRDDPATLDAFLAVKDGECPAISDDRDLGRKVWTRPGAARCLPPPLPSDELDDLDRLSAELAGPWPRAVRAIAALRELANRGHRDPRQGGRPFTPTLAQQKHFVEGCLLHPMCPLWLLDKPDKGLEPTLREARGRATPEQTSYIDIALRQIAGDPNARGPDYAKLETDAPGCTTKIAGILAETTGEPWMREARADALRQQCFSYPEKLGGESLRKMLPAADTLTAGIILGALATRTGKALSVPDVARVAADVRTRSDLFAKLEEGRRQREMPAAWAKEQPLVEAEAYAWVAHAYGTVPDSFTDETTNVKYGGKPARIVYVEVSAKGEYAAVPPVTVAVGPLRGPVQARHELTGTDWGSHEEGLRAFVEANMEEGRSVTFFNNFE